MRGRKPRRHVTRLCERSALRKGHPNAIGAFARHLEPILNRRELSGPGARRGGVNGDEAARSARGPLTRLRPAMGVSPRVRLRGASTTVVHVCPVRLLPSPGSSFETRFVGAVSLQTSQALSDVG